MFESSEYILLWSSNPDKLVNFYTEVLGLEMIEKTDIPAKNGLEKDYGYNLKLSPENILWIGHHSEVGKKNKDSLRYMINLKTNNIQQWHEKIKESGCKIIQEPIKTPFATDDDPKVVCTWLDPEGNCWQFMGYIDDGPTTK